MNWKLSGLSVFLGLFLATLLFSLGPIATGASSFFGLALAIEGIAIFIVAVPRNQPSSKLRPVWEWTLIGVVWILIALIGFTILSLHWLWA